MGTTLSNLRPPKGSSRRKKRLGRGNGSWGTSAGRGSKGQGVRRGGAVRLGFEGGQTPLYRRVPKRGFHNPFRRTFATVNVSDLARVFAADSAVTPASLREQGMVRGPETPIKVLGDGEIAVKLNVSAHAFSASAREKIAKAGGTIVDLPVSHPRKATAR